MNKIDRELINATEAIAKNFGVRYCTQCNRTQPVEGGKIFTLANGRTRWKCAPCFKRQRPPGLL